MKVNRISYILLLSFLSITANCQNFSNSYIKPDLADSILLKPSLKYTFETTSVLDFERDLKIPVSNSFYALDSSIRIKVDSMANSYDFSNKEEISKFFIDVKDMLIRKERFVQREANLFSETMDEDGAFKVHEIDCYGLSLMNITFAKAQGITLNPVIIRNHLITKVNLFSGESFYWDATKNMSFTREELKKEYKLDEQDIKQTNYLTVLSNDEVLATTYCGIASIMGDKGFDKGAIEWADLALKIFPKLMPAYFVKAEAYSELNNYNNAIAEIKKVIAIDDEYVEAFNIIGKYYSMDEKYQKGYYWFSKTIQFDKNNLGAHFGRGLCCALSGNKKGALNDYNFLISNNTSTAQLYAARLKGVIDK